MPAAKVALIPSLPIKDRYQEDWWLWWRDTLISFGHEVETPSVPKPAPPKEGFTDIRRQLLWDFKVAGWLRRKQVDFAVLLDAFWHPATISFLRLSLPKDKIFGYVHAGSYCRGDVQANEPFLSWERLAVGNCTLLVATNYHMHLLRREYPLAICKVVGFPVLVREIKAEKREQAVVVGIRKGKASPQTLSELEALMKKRGVTLVRGIGMRRHQFWKVCAESKWVISLAQEETFGLAVAEAVKLGCVPIVPDAFAYAELYPPAYLYHYLEEIPEKMMLPLPPFPRLGDPPTVARLVRAVLQSAF